MMSRPMIGWCIEGFIGRNRSMKTRSWKMLSGFQPISMQMMTMGMISTRMISSVGILISMKMMSMIATRMVCSVRMILTTTKTSCNFSLPFGLKEHHAPFFRLFGCPLLIIIGEIGVGEAICRNLADSPHCNVTYSTRYEIRYEVQIGTAGVQLQFNC